MFSDISQLFWYAYMILFLIFHLSTIYHPKNTPFDFNLKDSNERFSLDKGIFSFSTDFLFTIMLFPTFSLFVLMHLQLAKVTYSCQDAQFLEFCS